MFAHFGPNTNQTNVILFPTVPVPEPVPYLRGRKAGGLSTLLVELTSDMDSDSFFDCSRLLSKGIITYCDFHSKFDRVLNRILHI